MSCGLALGGASSTFEALDQELSASWDQHCFGDFVLAEHCGVARSTSGVERYRDELRPTLGRPDRAGAARS